MDYARYALGSYARKKWVVCTECSTPDKPVTVWEGAEREYNFAFVVNAVMHHEIASHENRPIIKRKSE